MNNAMKRTWAEIYLDNILHNYRSIRSSTPEGCKFLGVVKANAYGHGAVKVASLLEKNGADYLAVACIDEAVELRNAGISLPILILGHTPVEYTAELIKYNITQAISDLGKAKDFSERAAALGKKLKAHIKLDTGMSRLGFICSGDSFERTVCEVSEAVALPGLDVEGVFTHFAVSDEPDDESKDYTRRQFGLFTGIIEGVKQRCGFEFRIRHCANTGAVAFYHEYALDMVRPGLLLYGYGDTTGRLGLKPCMGVKTKILTIKEYAEGTTVSYGRRYTTGKPERMAVLGIGYADGLLRTSSNKCSYDINGKKAPQRGRICMDMCMVDVTDIPEADVGTVVEVFGMNNSLVAIAEAAGTIPYEFLCAASIRVPRVYF